MYNSYETVEAILKATPSVGTFLIDANKYYAHISPKHVSNPLPPETLQEHIELVQSKFELLTEKHGLDNVIDNLIHDFFRNQKIESNKLGNFLKRLFVNTVVFHDFGKINENFQASPEKMNNPHFKGKEKPKSILSTGATVLRCTKTHFDQFCTRTNSTYYQT